MPGLCAEVANAHDAIDREVAAAVAECRDRQVPLYCRRGCANCCRLAVHATWPEAERLAAHLSAAQQAALEDHVAQLRSLSAGCADLKDYLRRYRAEMNGCPFLDRDGACGVYAFRPLSCRALLSTRPGDWCGIDLAALPELDKQLYLSSLHPELADYPTHYLARSRRCGEALERRLLTMMAARHGVGISGNLAMLCWLAQNGLSAQLGAGGDAVSDFLAARAVSSWLVSLTVSAER